MTDPRKEAPGRDGKEPARRGRLRLIEEAFAASVWCGGLLCLLFLMVTPLKTLLLYVLFSSFVFRGFREYFPAGRFVRLSRVLSITRILLIIAAVPFNALIVYCLFLFRPGLFYIALALSLVVRFAPMITLYRPRTLTLLSFLLVLSGATLLDLYLRTPASECREVLSDPRITPLYLSPACPGHEAHGGGVAVDQLRMVLFDGAGRLFATAGTGGLTSGANLMRIELATGEVSAVQVNEANIGLALGPAGRRLYVASYQGGEVVSLDADTLEVRGRVKIDTHPFHLAFGREGKFLYAVAEGPARLYEIEPRAMKLTRSLGVEELGFSFCPLSIAYNPPSDRLFVTNYFLPGSLWRFDPQSMKLDGASSFWASAANANLDLERGLLYAALPLKGGIAVFDMDTLELKRIAPAPRSIRQSALDRERGLLHNLVFSSGRLDIYDVRTMKRVEKIFIGRRPRGLDLDPASGDAFVATALGVLRVHPTSAGSAPSPAP